MTVSSGKNLLCHVLTSRATSVIREELEALRHSLQPQELQALPQQQLDPPRIHPNDHVNMGQSSNDTIPTVCRAMRLALSRCRGWCYGA